MSGLKKSSEQATEPNLPWFKIIDQDACLTQLIDHVYSGQRHYVRSAADLSQLTRNSKIKLFEMAAEKVTEMLDIAEGGDVKCILKKDILRFTVEIFKQVEEKKNKEYFDGFETHGLLMQEREKEAVSKITMEGFNPDIAKDFFTCIYLDMQEALRIYRRKYLNRV